MPRRVLPKQCRQISLVHPRILIMRRDFADRGSWRGRDGNDPSVDIAKDADHRF